MTVWAQSSQRATWPPSAAVRQRSIALITFIWSRLTCPALALRHAAPRSRKISATSNAGRATAAGCYAGGRSFRPFLGFVRNCDSWSSGLSIGDHAGSDAGVARRRVQFVVTQQRLDESDIGTALEQVGREAVAQCVQRHGLLDPGCIGRFVKQAAQLTGGHRLATPVAGKQPAFLNGYSGIGTRWARLPPLAQQIECLWRQHDIAVLAAFGLLNPNDPLRTVDVLDLQPDHLAGAKAAAIAEAEQRADLEIARDGQQTPRLVRAHHLRNLLRLAEVINLSNKI